MSDFADLLDSNGKLLEAGIEQLASMGADGLSKVVLGIDKVAGAFVSPAIWASKYITSKDEPSWVDVALWGGGFTSAGAAFAVSALKAYFEDDQRRRFYAARADEPKEQRQGIFPVIGSSPHASAMATARRGYTVWLNPNGAWLAIRDAEQRPVCDYQPARSTIVIRPTIPFKRALDGLLFISQTP